MSEALKPQAGDILWADRSGNGLPYFHCGIYAGGGRVIHFAAPEGGEVSAENAVVHETRYERFAAGCPVKIIDCPEGFSGEETVRRARSRIGEKGYNLAANNCEHFAAWCKTGEHRSTQVDEAKDVIKIIGGKAGEIICAIHDVFENFKAGTLADAQPARDIIEKVDAHTEIDGVMPADIPVDDAIAGEETRNLSALIDVTPEDEAALGEDGPILSEDAVPYDEADGEPGDGEGGALRKKDVIDKIGGGIKNVTLAVAGALEVVKPRLPGPLKHIPYRTIALKVASTVDRAVVHIKRFFGRITAEQAHEALQNIDAAVLGETVAYKQTLPIKEAVKNTFGKVGAGIAAIAKKVVATIASPKLRNAIKTGAQKAAGFVSRGIRAIAGSKVVSGIKAAGKAIAGFFGFGRG
jgi:hypothetical protein